MKYPFLILICLPFFLYKNGIAQTPDTLTYTSLHQLIPEDRKLYFIGEFHIDDTGIYRDGPWHDSIVNTATLLEDSIRLILAGKCNVKTFVLESPVCFEYFYNKYITSGDEDWVYSCETREYQQNKIRSIRNIALESGGITIKCIDTDEKYITGTVIDALFLLTFFDNFDEGKEFSRTSVYSDTVKYWDRSFEYDAWRNKRIYNDTIRRFSMHIYNLTNEFSLFKSRQLYKLLSAAKEDSILQLGLRNYYQENYPYFVRLSNSYLNCYHLKAKRKKTHPYWIKREEIMTENLKNIIKSDTTSNYCLQIGNAHVIPNGFFENTRERMIRYLDDKPYNIIMLPQYYNCSACTGIENVNFDFDGFFRYEKASENEMYYIIK